MTVPMQLGIRAHDLGQLPLDELLEKMQDYGFSHAHFALRKSFPESVPEVGKLTPGVANYFGSHFQSRGKKISILGSYVNIVAPELDKRRQALMEFKKHIHLARDFGASMVATETGTVGAGYTKDNYTEAVFQTAVASVQELVAEAERFGVIVAIEAGINHPVYTASLAKRMVEMIGSPNLKIILDCANLMSVENHEQQEAVVAEALTLLDDEIIALHLKDFIVEDGKVKIVPAGQGWMDFGPILAYAKYRKPHIYCSLEATTEPHLAQSVAYLHDLYEQI